MAEYTDPLTTPSLVTHSDQQYSVKHTQQDGDLVYLSMGQTPVFGSYGNGEFTQKY